MRIDAGAGYRFLDPRAPQTDRPTARPSPAAPAATDGGGASASRPIDFTSMTRQEMRDWVNSEIRSGRMSLDESTPFVGLSLKISAETLLPVDAATDGARENFIEKTRLGVAGALSRSDPDEARRLQAALDIMLNVQGRARGVDIRA